jgi:hypothetical protein
MRGLHLSCNFRQFKGKMTDFSNEEHFPNCTSLTYIYIKLLKKLKKLMIYQILEHKIIIKGQNFFLFFLEKLKIYQGVYHTTPYATILSQCNPANILKTCLHWLY